ncbi:MAG: triple tyrosine motif-containing protein [Halioglobus sp.]
MTADSLPLDTSRLQSEYCDAQAPHFLANNFREKCREILYCCLVPFLLNPSNGLTSPGLSPQEMIRISPSYISNDLSQSTILEILHAKSGDLWLRTLHGLSRFNGNRIIDYRPTYSGRYFIDSVNISEIVEGPTGDILVATQDHGILRYNPILDSFSSPHWSPSSKSRKAQKNVYRALHTRNNYFWIGYLDGKVERISTETGDRWTFQLDPNERVTRFLEDQVDQILFSTSKGRIFKVQSSSREIELLVTETSCSKSPVDFTDIAFQKPEILLIGTAGSGLFTFSMENSKCSQYRLPKDENYEEDHALVHKILHDSTDKSTWIASDQGLHIIDKDGQITHFHSENSNLADNEVGALSFGNGKIKWVGSFTRLHFLSKTGFQRLDRKRHKKLRSIVALDGSKKLNTWIASYDGIIIFDKNKDTYSDIFDIYPNLKIRNERIMALSVSENEAWIGYRSTGLQRYLVKENQLITYNTESTPRLSSNSISAILTISSGETLIGTYGGGLNILHSDGSVEHLLENTQSQSISDNNVIMLFQSSDENIWVGTNSGLLRLDLASRKFNPVSKTIVGQEWPSHRVVFAIAESANRELWLGTVHAGLYRLTPTNAAPAQYSTKRFAPATKSSSNTIYAIEIDKQNNVWASTSSGITRVNTQTNEVDNFSKSNGLDETDFDVGASHKDSDGLLYFGGSNGYTVFNPENIQSVSPPPKIVLTELNIAGRLPDLPVPLQELELIELGHEDYYITFMFSALDFRDPAKNHYRYKLEGFDREWIDNDTRTSATYTSLPPGNYTFRVRGANSAGVWNNEGTSIRLKVLPPPWMSWWALLIYAAALLVALFFAKRAYDIRLIAKNATAKVLEVQEAANNAHDDLQEQLEMQDDLVRSSHLNNMNSLGLVQKFIGLQADFLEDGNMLDAILANQNRVQALSHLEDCMVYQDDAIFTDLKKYVDIILHEILKTSTISVETITTINEVERQPIAARIAKPAALIIYELLHNCVRHAFETGDHANFIKISMVCSAEDDPASRQWTLCIEDSGVGLPPGIVASAPESTGLAVVDMLIEELGGKLTIGVSEGTKFVAIFPDMARSDISASYV